MAAMASASTLAQSVEDRARAAAEASRAKSSTSKAIQENYLTPGLSGQPIATVDRSQSFTPSLACQKTRSEEHTSDLQSLMRISYAVFCLKTQTIPQQTITEHQ